MKERLDVLLVKKGLFATREKAKASIMAGLILVEGQIADKAGTQIKEDATITIKENLCPYVSRGGLKLEKAIDLFKIDLNGYVCIDTLVGGMLSWDFPPVTVVVQGAAYNWIYTLLDAANY